MIHHIRTSPMLGCALESLRSAPLRDGDQLAIGTYFPKRHPSHRNSSWSQTLLKAKRNDAWIIMVLGKILAAHLEYCLESPRQYTVTYVPGRNTLTRDLAGCVCSTLKICRQIQLATLLTPTSRHGKSQRHCHSIAERAENARGRYRIGSPDEVRGRNIILIDDIITTGATMRECSKLLRECGARSVAEMALARTVRGTRVLGTRARHAASQLVFSPFTRG